jgi:signal transduction histidine kinase
LDSGFNLGHAISEYRALRSSILFLWMRSGPKKEDIELADVTRFNETIDQAIAEVVRLYAGNEETFNDRFVAALGHEIRNSLNIIGMVAQALDKSQLEESQRKNVARLHKSVGSINRIVDDLAILIRSRMRVGLPLLKQSCDLGVIVEETLADIKLSNPGSIFVVEKNGDLTGTWDRLRLQQMIFNLAVNAVTYASDKQARIVIRGAGADVVLTISNRGRPIPEEEQQQIFEPFVHKGGPAPAQPSTGLGIGLFVVREIVEAHQGSIELESGNEGTRFTVRLPRISDSQTQ